jgi:hypothetical protein
MGCWALALLKASFFVLKTPQSCQVLRAVNLGQQPQDILRRLRRSVHVREAQERRALLMRSLVRRATRRVRGGLGALVSSRRRQKVFVRIA